MDPTSRSKLSTTTQRLIDGKIILHVKSHFPPKFLTHRWIDEATDGQMDNSN